MITIFKTGEFNYEDAGITKPVKYTGTNYQYQKKFWQNILNV